jgi:catechol 2,3-dioxygenase-like lactoylglutathione lyase family enzyme
LLDHITIGVSDFAKATAFYDAALAPLGIASTVRFKGDDGVSVVAYGAQGRSVFWFADVGATQGVAHVAFAAKTRAQVDAFHAAALAAGGRNNGAPGLRPHYDPDYYGAFVLDPDGHNIEAVCSLPDGG